MRFCILIILFILKTAYSKAQQQQYFHFDRITTQQGLPSDNTKKIIQDKQGFIWIGTSEGLCRFDGYHITTFTYNPAQQHSLINNFIYDLSEDENGNIWIATAGGWCELLYNTQTFLSAKDFKNCRGNAPDYFVQFILADHHHHIIMGGYAGSCLLNLKDASFQQFHLSKTNTVQTAGLINIYQDAQSLVWLQFQNYDCMYNPFKNELNIAFKNSGSYPLIKSSIPLLKQGNTLWIGRWSSYVCTYNLQTQTIKIVGKDTGGIKALTNDIQPRKMIADRQGNLWLLLEEEGVYYMDFTHKNFQVIKNDAEDYNSLPSQLVRDIMMDRDGNIWIATDKGIARWDNHAENFNQLQYTSPIPSFIPASRSNFEIDDVMENDSELWMAVLPIGLLVMNKNNPSIYRHIQIDSGNRISGMNRIINALFKDRDGNVWLSTQEGYARYDKQHDCLKPFYLSRHDITGNLFYQSNMMLQDDAGTIWVASKKGLGKLDTQTNTVTWFVLPATHKTGAPFYIYKIASQNNNKRLWLATDGGLFSFDKNTNLFSRYSSFNISDDWQAFDDCNDILFISDTVMVIASRYSGLIKFNYENKKFTIYSTINGLSSNNICGLYADKCNGLWITTLNGLSRLNLLTQTFSHYDYSNGLKDLTFPGNTSFYPEKDGNVLLLDGSYLFRFNPAQFAQKENVPQVAFTCFEKYDNTVFYDSPLNEMHKIHLAYNERYFTIRFSTLNFENASRTQYAYKMDGLDKQWHITNTPYVSYSNLSGGTYKLLVKASLDGNLWGNEKRLSILITPPFWKAWWFYTGCVALALLLIFSFYRMRINRLTHELYLRTKIARDLHDDVGSTLSSLHLVSALATKKIADDPHKTKELLEKITDSSERMTSNMQDIVWAVNPLNDSFAEIIARMQKFAAQMLESKNIELIFDANEKIKSIKVPLQYRSDLFMLFKEAVNNLAKYSNATHAYITLNKINQTFFLEVKDNGVGFDATKVVHGNGLHNMRERAKNLNGKLAVASNENGTTITLEFIT